MLISSTGKKKKITETLLLKEAEFKGKEFLPFKFSVLRGEGSLRNLVMAKRKMALESAGNV